MWDLGEITIPGIANPITGAPMDMTAVLRVRPQGEPFCGTMDGELVSPILVPLSGSTHAIIAIPSIDALPLDFPLSCF